MQSHRLGLTLIEVVAAIAILGTVLVGITLSQSRHTRQLAAANRQSALADAADQLLAGWWTRPDGVPLGESGTLRVDQQTYAWQTRLRGNDELARWGARVVRVSVAPFAGERGGAVSDVAEDRRIDVDLVLPDPDWEPESVRRAREAAQRAEPPAGEDGEQPTPGPPEDEVQPDPRQPESVPNRRGTQGGSRGESEPGDDANDDARRGREPPADQSDRWFERREKQ